MPFVSPVLEEITRLPDVSFKKRYALPKTHAGSQILRRTVAKDVSFKKRYTLPKTRGISNTMAECGGTTP